MFNQIGDSQIGFRGNSGYRKGVSGGSERRKCVMAVLNLYVLIKLRVTTFDTNHTVSDSTQSVDASLQSQ